MNARHYTSRTQAGQREQSHGVEPLFYGGKAWGAFGGQTPIYELAPI